MIFLFSCDILNSQFKKVMRLWRNWQTHKTKDLVAFKAVEVQVLLAAPKHAPERVFLFCFQEDLRAFKKALHGHSPRATSPFVDGRSAIWLCHFIVTTYAYTIDTAQHFVRLLQVLLAAPKVKAPFRCFFLAL